MGVSDSKLKGGGEKLVDLISDTTQPMLEEWTKQELTKTSLHGIRNYTTNSVLTLHVDRMPLVTSAVINAAQDAKEP
jgi:prolyl 4-hydroxylase